MSIWPVVKRAMLHSPGVASWGSGAIGQQGAQVHRLESRSHGLAGSGVAAMAARCER